MKRSVMKEVLKEYKELNLKSFSDGQILVTFPDMNNLLSVHITLFPKDGYYRGGKFDFALDLPISYPHAAAKVRSLTKMFHPNIDYSGSICFNILSSEWENCLRIADYAHALLWLLYQPNLDSRLNGDVPGDELEFAAMARVSVEGGSVAGQFFPGCLVDESKRLEEEEKAQQLEQRLEQNVEPEELAAVTPPTGAGVRAMRQFFDQQRAGGRTTVTQTNNTEIPQAPTPPPMRVIIPGNVPATVTPTTPAPTPTTPTPVPQRVQQQHQQERTEETTTRRRTVAEIMAERVRNARLAPGHFVPVTTPRATTTAANNNTPAPQRRQQRWPDPVVNVRFRGGIRVFG